MKSISLNDLSGTQKRLLEAAEGAMRNAYNPYSHFSVGAALLTAEGEIITGSNIENASYSSTICAERAALCRANAEGKRCFKSLAVIASGKDTPTKDFTAPCGSCRQMIFEASQISGTDIEIILSNTDKTKIGITSIGELLPYAFGPEDLGIDLQKWKNPRDF